MRVSDGEQEDRWMRASLRVDLAVVRALNNAAVAAAGGHLSLRDRRDDATPRRH